MLLELGSTDAAKKRYFEAAKLSEKIGKYEAALGFAERGLALDKDCLGEDHDVYLTSLKTIRRLEAEIPRNKKPKSYVK
jgi:hypothetical protein